MNYDLADTITELSRQFMESGMIIDEELILNCDTTIRLYIDYDKISWVSINRHEKIHYHIQSKTITVSSRKRLVNIMKRMNMQLNRFSIDYWKYKSPVQLNNNRMVDGIPF